MIGLSYTLHKINGARRWSRAIGRCRAWHGSERSPSASVLYGRLHVETLERQAGLVGSVGTAAVNAPAHAVLPRWSSSTLGQDPDVIALGQRRQAPGHPISAVDDLWACMLSPKAKNYQLRSAMLLVFSLPSHLVDLIGFCDRRQSVLAACSKPNYPSSSRLGREGQDGVRWTGYVGTRVGVHHHTIK